MRVDGLTKSVRPRLRKINKFPPNADYFNQTRTVENQLKFSPKCGSISIKSGGRKNQRRQILKGYNFDIHEGENDPRTELFLQV